MKLGSLWRKRKDVMEFNEKEELSSKSYSGRAENIASM